MNKKWVSCLAIMGLSFATHVIAADVAIKIDDQKINKVMTVWMTKNNIPGAVIEIYADEQSRAYYFGLADKDKKTPVTNKTLFEIGSLTKLFTSLLIAEEVVAGKISLDNSIGEYVPDLAMSSDYLPKVSLFNLATHTSGLPFDVSDQMTSRSQLPEYFSNWEPKATIGTMWGYSNINTGLLGYVLEASTHETINQLYRHRLLRPLKMQSIGIEVPEDLKEDYAQGYTDKNELMTRDTSSIFLSAFAMKASGDDMMQFLKAALQLPGTPPKILDAMRMTQTPYVKIDTMFQGLGWTIYPIRPEAMETLLHPELKAALGPYKATILDKNNQKFDGNALIDKTGSTDGFRAYIALIPARKAGIVILTNKYVPNSEIVGMGREILFDIV